MRRTPAARSSEYMGVTAASRVLGITRTHLWRLLKNGQIDLPFQQMGPRQRIFRREDVERCNATGWDNRVYTQDQVNRLRAA